MVGGEGQREENNFTHMRNFAVQKKRVHIKEFKEEFLRRVSLNIYFGDTY